MSKTFKGKNYSIKIADGTEVVSGAEVCEGFFILEQPQGAEVFELFEELVESHPICEESRSTFCDVIETAEMFCEYLPLDYAISLAEGLSSEDIEEDSPIVTKLIRQVERAGFSIEISVAADVLRGVCAESDE